MPSKKFTQFIPAEGPQGVLDTSYKEIASGVYQSKDVVLLPQGLLKSGLSFTKPQNWCATIWLNAEIQISIWNFLLAT